VPLKIVPKSVFDTHITSPSIPVAILNEKPTNGVANDGFAVLYALTLKLNELIVLSAIAGLPVIHPVSVSPTNPKGKSANAYFISLLSKS
jgi:hypothetical protein